MNPFDVMAALRDATDRLRAAGRDPWPGYDPGVVPVAIYDGTDTLLFGHPAPPPEFRPGAAHQPGAAHPAGVAHPPVTTHPPVATHPGLHAAVRANSVALIGDVLTATVMLPSLDMPVAAIAAVVAHEAFHVYQYQRHPDWGADESQSLTYPVTSASLHQLLLLEMEALDQALKADDAAPWARLALTIRRERYALLSSGAAAYERSVERLEGLAHYVEMQFAASGHRPLRFGPEDVRRRSYAVGLALATLLDCFAPGWKERLTQNDTLYLDELLDQALPADVPAAAIAAETAAALQARAESEVGEVAAKRKALREAFAARGGCRLEVVASAGDPLRPRGFDPMNLQVLTPSEVLHTRWLRLGSNAGSIEVFGQTLTEAAGDHPLFAGAARMTVAGLPAPPTVIQQDDTLTVTAEGIQATLRNAVVTQTGQRTIITIG